MSKSLILILLLILDLVLSFLVVGLIGGCVFDINKFSGSQDFIFFYLSVISMTITFICNFKKVFE